MPDNGLVTLQSAHDFATTVDQLVTAVEEKSITIFTRIDHAANAVSVGLALRPTTLVIFGNAAAGTPLMEAAQTAGIDLPLKVLIWQDADGSVKLTYNDPAWIAARHKLGNETDQAVKAMTAALDSLARRGAGNQRQA